MKNWLYSGFHARYDLKATEKNIRSTLLMFHRVTSQLPVAAARMAYRSLLYAANA